MTPDEHIIGLGKPLGNLHSSARYDMSQNSGKEGVGCHKHAVSGVPGRSPRFKQNRQREANSEAAKKGEERCEEEKTSICTVQCKKNAETQDSLINRLCLAALTPLRSASISTPIGAVSRKRLPNCSRGC